MLPGVLKEWLFQRKKHRNPAGICGAPTMLWAQSIVVNVPIAVFQNCPTIYVMVAVIIKTARLFPRWKLKPTNKTLKAPFPLGEFAP